MKNIREDGLNIKREETEVHRRRFEEDCKGYLCFDKVKDAWNADVYRHEMVDAILAGYLQASIRWSKELNNR